MRVSVRLFAALRERAGTDVVELELADEASVADALAQLKEIIDGSSVVMAVNQHYADPGVRLHPGDELALIPPVSGGAPEPLHVEIIDGPLRVDRLTEFVRDPRAGAVVTFLGVTRQVPELHYEAYVEMARQEMIQIVRSASERHGLCSAAAEHRVGVVALSEPSVAVAVSAPHRDAAFAGAREIIDQIKAQVPIWKKEESAWVQGTTPQPRA
jgi:molybdopterin converting factor subunit 1